MKKCFATVAVVALICSLTACSRLVSLWESKHVISAWEADFVSYGSPIKLKAEFYKDNTFLISGTNAGKKASLSGEVLRGDPAAEEGQLSLVILSMTDPGATETLTFTEETGPKDTGVISGNQMFLSETLGQNPLTKKNRKFLFFF